MNTDAKTPQTRNSNKWEYLFFAVFATYMIGQYLLLNRILLYFPSGFETENFYSPIAVHVAKDGFQGILNYLGGEMPPNMPYGPTFRPPLYPVTLAVLYLLTSANEVYALILNNIYLSLTVLFTYLTGRFISQRVGFLASFLLMMDIILISEANSTHSDSLFLVLVSSAHYFLFRFTIAPEKIGNLVFSAILISLAILTRNIGLYFIPAMLVVLVWRCWSWQGLSKLVVTTTLFCLIIGGTIGGWKWRNHEITGSSAFASGNMAVHLNHYYLPLVYAKRDGSSFDQARQTVKTEFETLSGFQDMSPEEKDEAKVEFAVRATIFNAHWVVLTLFDNIPKLILSYPFEVLATLANQEEIDKWRKFDEAEFLKRYERSNYDIAAKIEVLKYYWDNGMGVAAAYGIFNKIVNGLSFIAALVGVFLLVRGKSSALRGLGGLLFLQCFFVLAISILAPSARFRLPVMPFISIAAAVTLENVLAWIGQHQAPGTR
jgi:hypothetical protein